MHCMQGAPAPTWRLPAGWTCRTTLAPRAPSPVVPWAATRAGRCEWETWCRWVLQVGGCHKPVCCCGPDGAPCRAAKLLRPASAPAGMHSTAGPATRCLTPFLSGADLSQLLVGASVPEAWRPQFCSGSCDWTVGVLPGAPRSAFRRRLSLLECLPASLKQRSGCLGAAYMRLRPLSQLLHCCGAPPSSAQHRQCSPPPRLQGPKPNPTTSPPTTSRCCTPRPTRSITTRECFLYCVCDMCGWVGGGPAWGLSVG